MAFWTTSSSSQRPEAPKPGATKPVAVLFHCTADLTALVRLRLKAAASHQPPTQPAAAVAADDAIKEPAAAHAVAAMSSLYQLIFAIESRSADACSNTIMEVLSPGTLQLLCQKSTAAKVYKALMPLQKPLGFVLGEVKACISLTPLGLWELHAALQTAVIKALVGNSTGSRGDNGSTGPCTGSDTVESRHSSCKPGWVCLSRQKLVGCNLLHAACGVLATAPFVELEALAQPPNTMLLNIKAAGSVKFRPFSPMQALQAEAKSLQVPLQPSDTDQELLKQPAKLTAAARQLHGRAVKLLPDERTAFIKSLKPCPSNPAELQQLATLWRGQYGLQLPSSWPFMVGVAAHLEAEEAELQVPSCCVLTSLGLSVLPGSVPGGPAFSATLAQVVADLQDSQLQLWGHLKAEASITTGFGVGSAAHLQVSQQSQQTPSSVTAASAEASAKPIQYSLNSSWYTARDICQLQTAAAEAGAPKAPRQQQQQQQQLGSSLTAAAVQLMGLQEARADLGSTTGAMAAAAARAEQHQQLHRGSCSSDFSELRAFLAARAVEKAAEAVCPDGHDAALDNNRGIKPGSAAGTGTAVLFRKSQVVFRPSPAAPRAAASAAVDDATLAACRGPNRPGLPPPAAAAASSTATLADGASGSSRAPAAATAATGPPKAPALLKRPAAAVPAGTKPAAAAKKAKAATAAAVGVPKPPKQGVSKAKAAVNPAGAGTNTTGAAAGSAAAGSAAAVSAEAPITHTTAAAAPDVGRAPPAPTASSAENARKRAKASDLDLASVTAKVQAAFAASSGGSLKGVSVPEMQCYLRAQGHKGGSAKRADVEARLLGLLAACTAAPADGAVQ